MKLSDLETKRLYIIETDENNDYFIACSHLHLEWRLKDTPLDGKTSFFVRKTSVSKTYIEEKARLARESNKAIFIISYKDNIKPEYYLYAEKVFRFYMTGSNYGYKEM